MDDILEKTTIHIDSDYASFTSDSEFYVDIIDDIKNCIYLKTLKTEVFVKANYPTSATDYNAEESSYIENSIFNNKTTAEEQKNPIERNVFNTGDYIYISLNDINRINTISKKITVKTFDDIESNINNHNFGLIWTKVDKTPLDYPLSNDDAYNNLYEFNTITDANHSKALIIKDFNAMLKTKADTINNSGNTLATTTEELNDIITFTEQEYINMGLFDYKTFLKENNYYHHITLNNIIYRYVPTYIGYTKDNKRLNKHTWNFISKIDNTKADIIKYVYTNSKGPLLNPMNKVYNYKVKKEELNTLRYYDSIYINKPTIYKNLLTSPECYILSYKQELSGTSCGPNDTNTMVLNPILPELKRFNVKLWRINELGEHVEIPITNDGVFRVIMSFTVYYKRKKVTRV
tara:strand:+ start:3156 stop:4370 length:1215 start_codon:yes stop_codon:yes gene_type:complete